MPSPPDVWTILGDARPEDAGEVLLWQTSLIPLVVRRGWPLLSAAGVPPSIAGKPTALRPIALRLIARLEAIPSTWPVKFDPHGRWIDEGRMAGATDELASSIIQLSREFGSKPSRELIEWLLRNEVRSATRERWWAWYLYFLNVGLERTEVPAVLGASSEMVRRVIVSTFGPRSRSSPRLMDSLDRLSAIAERIPLSPSEQRLVTIPVPEPGDPPASHDVIAALGMAAERERARNVYKILAAALSEDELALLTQESRRTDGQW